MYTFTVADVATQIRRIAGERPDFNYKSQGNESGQCSYLGKDPRNPVGEACIVGQALTALGVTRADLSSKEGYTAYYTITTLLGGNGWGPAVGETDSLTLRWIAYVQDLQDDGTAWGEAVVRADAILGLDLT